jgi:ribosomal protein L14E/L6E/L27E
MRFNKENKTDLYLGQFCISKQGRDKDKLYIVYELVNEDYVLVVDGDFKKLTNPKKKNIKHLQKINDIIDDFEKEKLKKTLTDEYLKREIKLKKERLINVK